MAKDLAHTLGRMLRPFRPGPGAFASRRPWRAGCPKTITLESAAFENNGPMPDRHTAYGDGLSPPLAWRDLPPTTRSLALLVEDADAPSLRPLVHAILVGIPASSSGLAEGAIPPVQRGPASGGWLVGRNSLGRCGWLPIMPPPGHGPHRYGFQLFALDAEPAWQWPPGRGFMLKTIAPHIVGRGELIGLYRRK
ncbi:MAG: YbhB/YbcL family Raf kinase inhibitor-like protein [Acetobacteraceae bacterium]|nr:YbhB/YbcL family Raf kinase inhibitor-like protein [Acetobacteraceae bacterium]